ncbi:uncharacterized protein LOC111613382 [Centruroides sculpturatus]|uniref:uncharacterized protein LOC111613382 n=1 Tax=Centruroides sculpturatus TaxID=218467 RepID=UPI000C6D4BCC|nr:uncharacterized protein LOC111613382 [Centruroides sculpturatus]
MTNNTKPKCGIIVLTDKIDIAFVPSLTTQRITTAAIKKNPQLYIIRAYFAPDENDKDCIRELEDTTRQLNSKNFILVGDINAKSPSLHHIREDNRGQLMGSFMDSHDLYSANTTNHPTFFTAHAECWSNVFLAPTTLSNKIILCETLLDDSASDHRYILAEIISDENAENNCGLTRRTNWELFCQIFSASWRNYNFAEFQNEEDINHYANYITESLQKAEKLSTSITKTNKIKTNWWTDDLTAQQHKIRKIRRKMIKATDDNLKTFYEEEYKKELKIYKR